MKVKKIYLKIILIVGAILSLTFSTNLALRQLFQTLSTGIVGLRVHSQNSLLSEDSLKIYQNLLQPDIAIYEKDVLRIDSEAILVQQPPFLQLQTLSSSNLFLITVISSVLALFAVVAFLMISQRGSSPKKGTIPLILISATTCWTITSFYLSTKLSKGPWDEVFLLATQAKSFSQTLIWGVPISGEHTFAESSADTMVTIFAGLIMRLFPILQAETALVLTYSILVGLLSCFAALLLIKSYKLGIFQAVFIVSIVSVYSPSAILSSSEGMPTAVAVSALVVFGLILFDAISKKHFFQLGLYSLLFSLVRWEYGLLACFTSVLIMLSYLFNFRKKNEVQRLTSRDLIWLSLPILFFVLVTIFRFITFNSWVPSGVSSKGVGLDGAYLSSGLSYLASTSSITQWTWIIAVSISAIIFLGSKNPKSSNLILFVLFILTVPLFNSLIAGGDWFPQNWQRYVLPSLSAITLFAYSLISISKAKYFIRAGLFFSLTLVILLAPIAVWLNILTGITQSENKPQRTNCLATAGTILKGIVPDGQSIATAEVNTIAYFAERPVTDLIGLVDVRTANAPLAPREPGDLLHRRALPELIETDKPAAIYLWEGANCASNASGNFDDISKQTDSDVWSSLMNSSVSKYRIGNLGTILKNYTPVTVRIPNEIELRILIRKDLAVEIDNAEL